MSCSNTVIAREREQKKIDVKPTTVWSCGGGVDSTAIAVLIYTGKLEKPDYAVMTDCGYEKELTWEYVNGIIKPKLKEVGVELQIINTLDYTDNRLFDESGYILIPAYKNDNGKRVKFRTACNNLWKVQPVKKWLREQGVIRCENWIGMSADEKNRMRKSRLKWFQHRYPLVELGINREKCLWLIGSAGWPIPPKTSCIMCPQQNDDSWQIMKEEYPDDWNRAIEIEESIQEIDPDVYLHTSMRPLRELC